MPNLIGQHVRRARKGSCWHLIESEIGDRKVTKCGREMKAKIDSGVELEFTNDLKDEPLVCEKCTK